MANAISDKCAEIMMSNIRPKAEPIITAKITNPDGTIKKIEWKAKDIKNLTFKYEIDPIGRTLPYMELVWTEVYNENLDFETTKKYLLATKYMEVAFSVVQNLGFYNNWETIYKSGAEWKELFKKQTTWKQLKNDVQNETITFPVLFLEDKPKVEGLTITWTARDFLYYLNSELSLRIGPSEEEGSFPSYYKYLKYFLEQELPRFSQYIEMYNHIILAINEFEKLAVEYPEGEALFYPIFVSGNTKNAILNYGSIESKYFIFSDLGILKPKSGGEDWQYDYDNLEYPYAKNKTAFYNKTLFKKPIKTKVNSISEYQYKLYYFDTNNKWVSIPRKVKNSDYGDIFIEDNPFHTYDEHSNYKKMGFLNDYYDKDAKILNFEGLPHFEFLSGDVAEIESGEFYVSGEPVIFAGILVSQTLTYNGAFKQKNTMHEVNPSHG